MAVSKNFEALCNEAALAAEHIAIGVSSLEKANYHKKANYYQAFFALSIGFERTSKLAWIVDYAINSGGDFPSALKIKKDYGHDIKKLLQAANNISKKHKLSGPFSSLPYTQIHQDIVKVLKEFATNITRYYNIEFLDGTQKSDPINSWYEKVTQPILANHHIQLNKLNDNAQVMQDLFGQNAIIMGTSETGKPIRTLYDSSFQLSTTHFANQYTRMYVMQIARFLAYLLIELGYEARKKQLNDIPNFADFFAIFQCEDKYLRNRKTWSIYKT